MTCLNIILATTDNIKEEEEEDGGNKNCLTTYVFNPVDTCTATPSPEKYPLNDDEQTKKKIKSNDKIIYAEKDVIFYDSNNIVGISTTTIGNNNQFMAEYKLRTNDYRKTNGTSGTGTGTGTTTASTIECGARNCCEHDCNNKRLLNYGPLYTITCEGKEERTYDEPYTGDLPRRSWLCCPGSQQHIDTEQPPLLEQPKTPPSNNLEDTIIKAPTTYTICSIGCVRILIYFHYLDLRAC